MLLALRPLEEDLPVIAEQPRSAFWAAPFSGLPGALGTCPQFGVPTSRLAITGALESTFYSLTTYSGWALVWIDSITTDSTTGYANQCILATQPSAYWSLYLRYSGLVGIDAYTQAGLHKQVETAYPLTPGWHLIQWTFDTSNNLYLRVDGGTRALINTGVGSLGYLGAPDPICVGQNYAPDQQNKGRVAEIGLTNITLSNVQEDSVLGYINARYGLTLGGVAANTRYTPAILALTGWWRSDGYGTTALGASAVTDSYASVNQDTDFHLYASGYHGVSQSFTGDGKVLQSTTFYLKKTGSPTGSGYARIYAHSGTFGASSIPTGAALATSGALDVSTLTTTYADTSFTFAGDGQITLASGTKYCVVFEYSGGDISNVIKLGVDISAGSHAGNQANNSSEPAAWSANAAYDACFSVTTASLNTLWKGQASAGASGSRNLTEATNPPDIGNVYSPAPVDTTKPVKWGQAIVQTWYGRDSVGGTSGGVDLIASGGIPGPTTGALVNGRASAVYDSSAFYSPVVRDTLPRSGLAVGGTSLFVIGDNFVSGCTVTVGGASATSVVYISSTQLSCVTPSGTAGAKDVVVTNPGAHTSTGGAGLYTYIVPGVRMVASGGVTASLSVPVTIAGVAGDLLVVFTDARDSSGRTCSDNAGGTYTKIEENLHNGNASLATSFVRNTHLTVSASVTVTITALNAAPAEMCVVAVEGMSKSGSTALRQYGHQNSGILGTPAPAFHTPTTGEVALTTNVCLGAVGVAVVSPNLTPPTSWTEQLDAGQSNGDPKAGLEVVSINSGFTATSVTWGSATTTDFTAFILELDCS